ncbi:YggU family protein [bacterium]|nr:YggU family protein [bacterium]
MYSSLNIKKSKDGVLVDIKVLPKSSRNEIAGVVDGKLKVKLTAPPVNGKANKALITFLSKKLNLSKRDIVIVKGQTSANKQLSISLASESLIEKFINATRNQ